MARVIPIANPNPICKRATHGDQYVFHFLRGDPYIPTQAYPKYFRECTVRRSRHLIYSSQLVPEKQAHELRMILTTENVQKYTQLKVHQPLGKSSTVYFYSQLQQRIRQTNVLVYDADVPTLQISGRADIRLRHE